MRVCYVSTQAVSADGWGRYTVEVALGAQARGIEPVLVTAREDVDEGLSAVEHHPILPPLFMQRFTTPRTLLKTPALRRILHTCDAVHCIAEPYAPLTAAARPLGMPFVLSVFGTWAIRPIESGPLRSVFMQAFRSADLVISISDYTRRRMAELIPMPRTEVLPGGVHPERFEEPVDASHLPAWAGQEPVVFSAGALKPRKGQHVALEAVALARERVSNLHYAMAGSLTAAPQYVDRLRARANALGIAQDVHFLGLLPPYGALTAWYQHAEAFILPSVSQGSSFEGLGFVFLEAGAAGTPSIGTLDCGAEEAIEHGVTGFTVPQDDPYAAADAIVALLTDDDLRAQMGQAANRRAYDLSWDRLADRVVALYGELTT
ncbi:MAG: glycosyltransferase family 4 protein [Chloroflexi bacterium]|nr:glycosyltransferase family 4 protein [Chloroflexota bacterium]